MTDPTSDLAPSSLTTLVDEAEQAIVAEVLRIVPILGRHHHKPATLVYHGGPLLTSCTLVPVFYGAGWQDVVNVPTMTSLVTFLHWLPTSPLIAQLAEYSVPEQTIGNGDSTAPAVLLDVLPPLLTDADIQAMLEAKIADGTIPVPTPQTLYVILVEPGVAVSAFGSKSCNSFCGYHEMTPTGVYYAVLPYPGCPGCLGSLTAIQALTSTISHEICEAITDAKPGAGWVAQGGAEIGDLCAWSVKSLDGWTIQKEFSNASHSCV